MRASLLFLLLFSSVSVSCYLFNHDAKKDTGNTSIFLKSFQELKPYLRNTSDLNVKTNEPAIQHLLEARYILFPVQLHMDQNIADTMLYILTKKDSSIKVTGQKIWQKEDERFRYYLVKKQ